MCAVRKWVFGSRGRHTLVRRQIPFQFYLSVERLSMVRQWVNGISAAASIAAVRASVI